MCTPFGIAPIAYISGITTRAYRQDDPYMTEALPIPNRITWRHATFSDRNLKSEVVTPFCDPEELALLLYQVDILAHVPVRTSVVSHSRERNATEVAMDSQAFVLYAL
jgi:hypothetical protein